MPASFAEAQGIHKCATTTGIAYQTEPCAAGQIEVAVLAIQPAARSAERSASDAVEGSETAAGHGDARAAGLGAGREGAHPRSRWMPHRSRAIATGMSDDEVLNTPEWGVPTRITRSRGKRAWQEVWVYETRAGSTRQLSFTNGMLTDIEIDRVGGAPAWITVASAIAVARAPTRD